MVVKKIRQHGHSPGLLLDKGIIENVYKLNNGDEVDVDYKYPRIIITPRNKVGGTS